MVTRIEKKAPQRPPEGAIGRLASTFLKNRPRRVLIPRAQTVEEMEKRTELQRKSIPTIIPKLTDEKLEEIEIQPIKDPFSFVRIVYNRELNDYIYEVIEPQLTPEEDRVLRFVTDALIKTMEYHFDESTSKEKEEYLRTHIRELLKKIGLRLNEVTLQRITYYIIRDFVGYGPIDVLMTDEMIEDISCDGPKIPLFVYHKKYESMRSNIIFSNDPELDSFVIGLAQKCGKHISVAEPMLDATIPDGSRLQATLAREVTTRGSSFTIRRFRANPFTPPDLLRVKTMSSEMLAYLWLAVEQGDSIVVCGGTACGKTSTLNAILLFIPPAMKIITIEDTREINLPHENWIAGLTRGGFGSRGADGKAAGEIDMYELLRAALRQRPQYLIVGEVRGIETYTMFQAMATGHTVYSTMHADSVKSMVYRLENPPINLPRILLSSLNVVVIQAQVKVGKGVARRIKSIVEIVGIEPETNELITNTVYVWSSADDNFTYNGHSFLFERIMNMKNMTTSQMKEEFKRRVEIIEWMGKANVRNYIEVASIVSAYYKDPESTIKKVRTELYGT
ncbi:MAG: type II/IV secretion system ATPase subunit [Thermoplasmatota archaeon]